MRSGGSGPVTLIAPFERTSGSKKAMALTETQIQNLVLLGVTTIFFPIFPGVSETQPLLLLGLAIGLVTVNPRRVTVNVFTILLLYFFLLASALLLWKNFEPEFVVELSKLLLVLFLGAVLYQYVGYGSRSFYVFFIALHVLIASLVVLGVHEPLAAYMGRYTALEGGRGLSYLANEPSYAATYVFYVLLVYTLGLKAGIFTSRIIQILLGLILLSTMSLLGFMYLFLIFLIGSSGMSALKRFAVVVALVITAVFATTLTNRVTEELWPLMVSVFGRDSSLLETAIHYPSVSTRFILNGVAFFDGFDRLLLFPERPFEVALPLILAESGWGLIAEKHEVISALLQMGVGLKPQALFPYAFFVFGLMSIPLLYYPIVTTLRAFVCGRFQVAGASLVLIFLFYFYQSQYVNPIQIFVFMILGKYIGDIRRNYENSIL